jgi:hypothetical protein
VLSSLLHVSAWSDPLVDRRGHPITGRYVELFWLPVLGPSATFFLRRCALLLDRRPEGMAIDLDQLGPALGLGRSLSSHAPLTRAIDRCVRFGMARRAGTDHLAVRRVAGPLPRHHVDRLPPQLKELHSSWLGRAPQPAVPTSRDNV